MEYRQLGPDGTEVGRAMAYWDLDTNEGGSASSPQIEQQGNVDLSSGEIETIELFISDDDTPVLELTVEATSSNPELVPHPTARKSPTGWGLDISAGPTASGQVSIEVIVSDSDYDRTMSFSVYIDSSGTPWGGFIDAYFTAEEQLDADLISPIEDPDLDNIPTLLEFVFGSNPREYSPASEQLKASPRHIAPPDGIGEGDEVIDLRFQRRNDEPRIKLALYGSPDGDIWTELKSEPGAKSPLYKENTNTGENPLYDDVEGTANPPDDPPAYFIRAIAEMN